MSMPPNTLLQASAQKIPKAADNMKTYIKTKLQNHLTYTNRII